MSDERLSDADAALDRALRSLPEPALPSELRLRLEAIPARGNVRRFPVRSWRASAFGWAAAAAIGLFVGASFDAASPDTGTAENEPAEAVSSETRASLLGEASTDDEDENLALAIGSFTELEEEP